LTRVPSPSRLSIRTCPVREAASATRPNRPSLVLLSIGDRVGGAWPLAARKAAEAVSGDRLDGSIELDFDQRLLADIKTILNAQPPGDVIGSIELCTALAALPDSPWAAMRSKGRPINEGKPITTTRLALMLKKFEVYPKHTNTGNE